MSENVQLAPNKRKAIEALLTGCTYEEAAVAAGVTSKTLQRWRKDADFRGQLDAAQSAMLRDTYRRLLLLGEKAVEVLGDALKGDTTAEQRRAAGDTLRHIISLRQSVELEARVAALEQALAELDNAASP
jgi:hypothetical protein